jgi:hypothetical protein
MASGVPVITYDEGGHQEIVINAYELYGRARQ